MATTGCVSLSVDKGCDTGGAVGCSDCSDCGSGVRLGGLLGRLRGEGACSTCGDGASGNGSSGSAVAMPGGIGSQLGLGGGAMMGAGARMGGGAIGVGGEWAAVVEDWLAVCSPVALVNALRADCWAVVVAATRMLHPTRLTLIRELVKADPKWELTRTPTTRRGLLATS